MLDRKTAPPHVQTRSFELIQPEVSDLPNGVKVFLIPGGEQQVMKIELIFPAGRWFEEHWGASYFASHLLSKGTNSKSSFAIASIFDFYGAHLEISPGLDVVSVSLYSLSKTLAPVLELLIEILTAPSFNEKELQQLKDIYVQNLKVNNEKTSFLASKTFRKNLFGDQHPYGKELEEGDVEGLTRGPILTHFEKTFSGLRIFVSGKIDPLNKEKIIQSFSGLKNGTPRKNGIRSGNSQMEHEYIEKEGSVQSSVRFGKKAVLRSDPDYGPCLFVSHILGGYFGSRLMKNIREDKGLTYGIYSSLHALQHDSYLVIGADVNKENVSLTFEEIRKELKRLRTEKISSRELETARNHFIGNLQSELSTPFAHADKIRTIELFDLAPDFYQRLILSIDQMNAGKIIEISEGYFDESQFKEVAVG